MDSSMPNRAMNAGRKAVMGMERMGAATGLTRSCTQRKLPISRPSGMAITAHQKKACAMRHQLWITLPSRSYSVQSRKNARITPSGLGRENGGRMSQWVSANQARTTGPSRDRQDQPRAARSLFADCEEVRHASEGRCDAAILPGSDIP